MKYKFLVFSLLITSFFYSQTAKIIDKHTGKSIKNVNVFNESLTLNLSSDDNGNIDLSSFKNNEIIVFSHVVYSVLKAKKSSLTKTKYKVYLTKQQEELNEVVLSIFKKPEKPSRIAEQIAFLDAKDIKKISPQTSADLLAVIPGIKVQKSQFGGGSPVIRGMESNRVLLVLDGVRLNNAIYRKGHLQNSITVSPNILDKIEVAFGPSSVLYGSDALGGVIHYHTKTPKISEQSKVKNQLFSRYSTVNQEITTSISTELSFAKWAWYSNISYSNFKDLQSGKNTRHGFKDWGKVFYYSENTDKNYKETPTKNSNPSLLKNTGYNQTDILQKFFIPLTKNSDLKVNLQYSTSSNINRFDMLTELTDIKDKSSLKYAEWYYGPQNRLLLSSQILINSNSKFIEKGTITAAYQNIKESRIQRKFGSLDRTYRKENIDVYSINGDFFVPLTKDKKRVLSYGFELVYNDVNSTAYGKTLDVLDGKLNGFSNEFKVQTRYPDGGSNYLSSAVYLNYRQDITSKSTLNSGIRYTNTNLNATWLNEQFIKLPVNDISINNSAITATIGYVYKPNKNWQINSVLSSGFRSPNIDDVGRVREKRDDVTVPNIFVQPEFAYNAELGIKKLFNNKINFGTTFFYTLLDNYIMRDNFEINGSSEIKFDTKEGNIVANQNRGNAYILGSTANYFGKISDAWSTSGFVTYTKGRTYDTNEPMSSIPPLFGQFEINYKYKKLEIGGNLRFNSKKDIKDFNLSEGIDNHDLTPIVDYDATKDENKYYGTPSWVTIGLRGKYIVSSNLYLQAILGNIFDEHYIEFASGVASPGRNLSISFTANF